MDLYLFASENREFLKVLYGLIIVIISTIIVLKTHKLFKISLHQGIRYFRNAFLFFGLGFFTRYLIGTNLLAPIVSQNYFLAIKVFVEFFFIMAGFFLLYSLIWKRVEGSKKPYLSSLANPIIAIFYSITAIIILLDISWGTYYFMFASQVLIFILASIISLSNYINNGSKHQFLKFYFLAMLLSLIAWVSNALTATIFNWDFLMIINISVINVIIFLLFLFGVIYVTRR